MLEPEHWNSALSSITGTLVRGTERVSTAHCLNLLEVGPDPVIRQKVGKRGTTRCVTVAARRIATVNLSGETMCRRVVPLEASGAVLIARETSARSAPAAV
jgi:stage III sporulation protein SpoIIIAA